MPAHRAAATVGEAITSALDQQPAPHEVIVCIDGDADGLDEALRPFGDRVVVLRQEHRGASAARNRALAAATGEFVDFLDADDVYLPGRLDALARLATERPELDLLTTDVAFVAGDAVVGTFYGANEFPVERQREVILERNWLTIMTAARREAVQAAGGFDESLEVAEDWDLWQRLVLGGCRAGLVPRVLAHYRIHDRSLSADRGRAFRGRAQVLRKVATDGRLGAPEVDAVRRRAAELDRAALLADAENALLTGGGDARRRSLAVAMTRGVGRRARAEHLLAAAAPGLARRAIAARGRRASSPRLAAMREDD